MKTYRLFISHSWTYADHYYGIVNLLKKRSYFDFIDYSVPKDDPVHGAGTDEELRQAIKNHMQPCQVVLIMAGIYSTYSKWINIEINLAKEGFSSSKPIVAIEPWGSERTSTIVKEAADKIVKWNTESIVSAIRSLA